ncbi:MAG: RagB/SusD family nutrient uptake outer membrane protein [Bacteroidales bacterium]
MKTKNIFSALFSGMILLSSCESILEVDPANSVASKDAIKDRNSAIAALRGMYSSLQADGYYGQYMVVWPDLAADNLEHTGTFSTNNELDANHLLATNTTIAGIWGSIYNSVSRANYILKYVPQLRDVTESEKADMKGQAYFVRALGYSNLVKMFGAVPIILDPVTSVTDIKKPSRSPKEEVYAQILKDLDSALSNLPVPSTDEGNMVPIVNGMAGYYSAMALKARVSLFMEDYASAMACADSVINSQLFGLAGSYAEIFNPSSPYSPESIFELDFTSQDANSLAFWFFYDDFGGRYEYAPTAELITALEEGEDDDRLWVNTYHYVDTAYGIDLYMGTKYVDIAAGSDNVIILRLAEMYLIRAEASLHGISYADPVDDAAIYDINSIRNRAGAKPYPNDHNVTLDDILKERRLEFAFEGHRWFDLVRTGKVQDFVPTVTSQNQWLWPVPQRERDVNSNLDQNTGY